MQKCRYSVNSMSTNTKISAWWATIISTVYNINDLSYTLTFMNCIVTTPLFSLKPMILCALRIGAISTRTIRAIFITLIFTTPSCLRHAPTSIILFFIHPKPNSTCPAISSFWNENIRIFDQTIIIKVSSWESLIISLPRKLKWSSAKILFGIILLTIIIIGIRTSLAIRTPYFNCAWETISRIKWRFIANNS